MYQDMTPRPQSPEIYSFAEVDRRITAMVKTLKFMSDPEWRFLSAGGRINWPATVYDAADLAAQRENHDNRDEALQPPKFKPSAADLSRLDETASWFQCLEPLDFKTRAYLIKAGRQPLSPPQLLIWRVGLGASPHSLSKMTGDHHETIRRRHLRALERLHAIANKRAAAGRERLPGRGAGRSRRAG